MLNKVMVMGNAGKAPEAKYTTTGAAYCVFTIATDDGSFDKETNQWKSNINWHNISVWGKAAERAVKNVTKGSTVFVEGKVTYSKSGDKYFTNINASSVKVVKKKEDQQQSMLNDDNF